MLEIKQLDSLQTTPRSMKSANGEDITYNLEILQWCLNNAPEPTLLSLMDNIVNDMWDAYKSVNSDEDRLLFSNLFKTSDEAPQFAVDSSLCAQGYYQTGFHYLHWKDSKLYGHHIGKFPYMGQIDTDTMKYTDQMW